ncbi:MAG: pantoate--beta-alanine ligase [Bacteroidetes bacterium]|nr:MAG: pantoate--beta-alanine ligase [Bacteroidota bacterium]
MYIYRDISGLQKHLDKLRIEGGTIGFVPTMGALHEGHMALVTQMNDACDHSVVSIFVNPTQFNDPGDLTRYPKPIEDDIKKLYDNHCDIVFIPSVDEVYPNGAEPDPQLGFDGLDERMEGQFRPGHFGGVAQVMHRLLTIVNPQRLFMGQKDFQQSAIVKHMISHYHLPVKFVTCPTVRESDGLAMSSRNRMLDPKLRDKTALIFQALRQAKEDIDKKSVADIRERAMKTLTVPDFRPEYFEIADGITLLPVKDPAAHEFIVACVAVWAGDVRLIDNMIIRG